MCVRLSSVCSGLCAFVALVYREEAREEALVLFVDHFFVIAPKIK